MTDTAANQQRAIRMSEPHRPGRLRPLLPQPSLQIGHLQPQAPPLHLGRVQPLAEEQEVLLEGGDQGLMGGHAQRSKVSW